MEVIEGGPGGAVWWDKVPSKFANWGNNAFRSAGFRAVPGSIVRRGAFIGQNVVLMPSFVNLGAYVDAGTMVDTWATVGSCAQIGKNCHLSGGIGIGGVLEPVQAGPTIIEDDCFIGARSEVVEGVVVRRGSVLGMGVFISASTKIVERDTGKVHIGEVPSYSVVVPGTLPGRPLADGTPGPALACAVIVKRVDEHARGRRPAPTSSCATGSREGRRWPRRATNRSKGAALRPIAVARLILALPRHSIDRAGPANWRYPPRIGPR